MEEKVSISYISDGRLLSRTRKELKKQNVKKINNPILKKQALELNREFLKQGLFVANKHFKKNLRSLAIIKM